MTRTLALLALICATPASADETPKLTPSTAKIFPYEAGVMDLLVTGPAAQSLYDALPGKGVEQACGATGLHKGDGKMSCAKNDADYACHIWIDTKAQALTLPETDDC
ncbi:hypothetical protein [Sphingomonas crocodyli]|uniref:DUF2282 domain-containing protein n=1 Tax=Sphingomonas crocodyli TaxID=1979270 RepID=A0A437M0R9_9SPHN|nr:hypothetical protein [Sphingomonas crocodyli]RVT91202.1 hypothetical protein EOD43_16960 [Sphingomonas crocodyli]